MAFSDELEQILDLVFPTDCLACGKGGGRVLCETCIARVASSCSSAQPDASACRFERLPGINGFRAAGPYQGILKELVLHMKSSGKPFAFPLARLMVAAAGNDPDYIAADAVYYVPSEKARVKERGHNPAEVLAVEVSTLLGRPLSHGLEKTRATRDQDRLPAALRWGNVSGAFRCAPGFRPRGSVLLVDDVLTTGATAGACAGALLDAGAEAVYVLVAARAVFHAGISVDEQKICI